MNYPHLKIVSDSRIMGTIILFYESEDAQPIDISGVVQTVEVSHVAGQAPWCTLQIPVPVLDMQVEVIRTTIEQIEGEALRAPKYDIGGRPIISPTPTQEDV